MADQKHPKSLTIDQRFELCYQDVADFVEARGRRINAIIAAYPKTYSTKGMDASYCEGWMTGFRRCLVYIQEVANKQDKEQASEK